VTEPAAVTVTRPGNSGPIRLVPGDTGAGGVPAFEVHRDHPAGTPPGLAPLSSTPMGVLFLEPSGLRVEWRPAAQVFLTGERTETLDEPVLGLTDGISLDEFETRLGEVRSATSTLDKATVDDRARDGLEQPFTHSHELARDTLRPVTVAPPPPLASPAGPTSPAPEPAPSREESGWPVGPGRATSEEDRLSVRRMLADRYDALLVELRDGGLPAGLSDSYPTELVGLRHYLSDLETLDKRAAAGDREARSLIRCAFAGVRAYAGLGQLPVADAPMYYSVRPREGEDPALSALELLAVLDLLPVGSQPAADALEVILFAADACLDVSAVVGKPAGSVWVAHPPEGYEPLLIPEWAGPGVPLFSLNPAVRPRR
jgi:hypothetical protein